MKNLLLDKELNREIDPAFRRRAKIITKNLELKKNDFILEVGCGRGFYANIIGKFFPQCKYVGIDLNRNYLNVAKNFVKSKNVQFQYGNALNLPFINKSFDKVICSEVLEHLKDDRGALNEIYRVLKPGGAVIITVPNKNYPFLWDPLNWILEKIFNWHIPSNIWWLAGIWADHLRLYTEDEIISKIKNTNFHIVRIWRSTKYCIPFSHFLLYGVGKNIVEKGVFTSFNRFKTQRNSFLKTVLLKLVDFFDRQNNRISFKKKDSYLNFIVKIRK